MPFSSIHPWVHLTVGIRDEWNYRTNSPSFLKASEKAVQSHKKIELQCETLNRSQGAVTWHILIKKTNTPLESQAGFSHCCWQSKNKRKNVQKLDSSCIDCGGFATLRVPLGLENTIFKREHPLDKCHTVVWQVSRLNVEDLKIFFMEWEDVKLLLLLQRENIVCNLTSFKHDPVFRATTGTRHTVDYRNMCCIQTVPTSLAS